MSVEIFVNANFSGATSGALNQNYPYIGDFWNDQISSIRVYSGTWEFFEHRNFQGKSFQLTPGEYPWVIPAWNDLISSFRQVEPGVLPVISGDRTREILSAHNRYRAAVGVASLRWSVSLAASAQKRANHLAATEAFEQSRVAENLAQGSAGEFSVAQLVDRWGAERQYFSNGIFPGVSTTGNWADVSHYTQVVWNNTTEVGCGLSSVNGNDVLVCHYSPAGNVTGQKVF